MQTDWLRLCVDMISAGFDYKYGDKVSMDAFSPLVPHVMSVADHVSEKHGDDATLLSKASWAYSKSGFGFLHTGKYENALEMYNKALLTDEQLPDKDITSTATIYNNIAMAYNYLGKYDLALVPRPMRNYDKTG